MFQWNCPSRKIFLIALGLVMLVTIEARAQLGSRETKEWIQNLGPARKDRRAQDRPSFAPFEVEARG